jgi:thiamine-phosphate pyrophosphorylase
MERAIYRIIDANFNRAREAIRSIEEFCRFALNSERLTGRAKQLRHELSSCIDGLEAARLVSSRDTLGDVGVGQKVDKQLSRRDLHDCCTAACKRLSEALRVLAEALQIQNRQAGETIEKLRYTAYTLEKDILLQSDVCEKFGKVRLYIVITSNLPAEVISLAGKCAAGGADCIQLRAKKIEDDTFFNISVEFVKICKDAGIVSIINDRTDIAVAAGADGVHLGQNDLPVAQARKLELSPLIIGKSTHSLEQLRSAFDERPTYVGLGPVFTTATKPNAPSVGLDYVKEAVQMLAQEGLGHVAIGGVTTENVGRVLAAGATSIAVCSAVTHASDPAEACRELKRRITAFQGA